jgi:hypothetical protein
LAVTNFQQRYMERWRTPGLTIGYEDTFVHACAVSGRASRPASARADLPHRAPDSALCDSILQSAKTGQWVETGIAA